MSKVRVTKSEPPESTEILAEAIVRIGQGFERLKLSGLNQRAIVILLHWDLVDELRAELTKFGVDWQAVWRVGDADLKARKRTRSGLRQT